MSTPDDRGREFLRHAVATLAYRGGKAVRGAPPEFAARSIGAGARTPVQILAHIGDLFDWALSMARGAETWNGAAPLPWDREVERFFASLTRFDEFLASGAPLQCPPTTLFQGPVADALTHVGQLAMCRRLAGSPVRAENYARAEISPGRLGADQAAPKREFD